MKKKEINGWIVCENRKVFTRKVYPTIDEAKSHCINDFTNGEKRAYIDESSIIHVVDGYIVSEVDVWIAGNEVFFSDVHITHNQIKYLEL